MKRILLLIVAFLPLFGFSQSDLVRWGNTNQTPTLVASNISAASITASSGASFAAQDSWCGHRMERTVSDVRNYDANVYFQFAVSANSGYKIDLSQFIFRYYRGDSNEWASNIRVRYSKTSNFSSGVSQFTDILSIAQNSTNTASLNFPVGTQLNSGETMYIRIHIWGGTNQWWNAICLRNSGSSDNSIVPTITGTVTSTAPVAPVASNDTATTTQNGPVVVDVLGNDTFTALSAINITQNPANGTVTKNGLANVTYTPSNGFTGTNTFKYTITAVNGTSNEATVTVNVNAPVLASLVRWNNTNLSGSIVSNNIIAGNITANGVTIAATDDNNTSSHRFATNQGWPSGTLDTSKYIEFSVTGKTGYKIDLDQFMFTYKAAGSQKLQVRYSKDNFATYQTMIGDSNANTSWTTVSNSLSSMNPLFPGQTIKIRIYAYNTYNLLDIKRLLNSSTPTDYSQTPVITGTAYAIDNTPIAVNDNVSMLQDMTSEVLNVLSNDMYNAGSATIAITQNPTNGQATISGQNISYTPNTAYTGSDILKYTITDVYGTSNEATVAVTVNAPVLGPMIRWDNNNLSPTIVSNNILAGNITSQGVTITGTSDNNTTSHRFTTNSAWPSGALDTSKYIEFSVTGKTGYKIDLNQFTFTYKGANSQKFQVRYSKDNFATYQTMIGESSGSNSWTTVSNSIAALNPVLSGETVKIRIYVYNSYNIFDIKRLLDTNTPTDYSQTPVITGTVSAVPAPVTITTWNGTSWSNNQPTSAIDAVIANDYNTATNGNLTTRNLTINTDKVVSVHSGGILTVQNNVTNNGSIIIENNGSFVQVNDNGTYTGSATSFTTKRITQPIRKFDFTYWSSPVRAQDWRLIDLSPNTLSDKFYSYNPSGSWIVHNGGTAQMQTGVGYGVRAPQTFSETSQATFSTKFVGIPNNGIKTVTLGGANTYNLIGNPYASALDADKFITLNEDKIIGTLYFWTHNTPMANYVYSAGDYAAYNKSGSVATQPASSGGVSPSGVIASGQAFFVQRKNNSDAVVTFNNQMRVGAGNNQFFRPGQTETDNAVYKHRFWLNVSNANNAYSEMLVGYISGATDAFDASYDGETFGGTVISMYSRLNQTNLAIQGKSLPFDENDVIPVGYTTTVGGQFNINLNKFDGVFEAQDVFLEDKLTNTITNLKEADYAFTTAAGTFDNRFEVRFVNTTLGIDVPTINDNSIVVYRNGGQIDIKSKDQTLEQVTVYDLLGKVIFDKNNIKSNSFSTSQLMASNQVVIVKVITDTKAELVKKVIMN